MQVRLNKIVSAHVRLVSLLSAFALGTIISPSASDDLRDSILFAERRASHKIDRHVIELAGSYQIENCLFKQLFAPKMMVRRKRRYF